MYTQYRTLSEVWLHLQNRHDSSNILRELLGQHAVDSTLQDDVSQNIQDATRSIIWIKTIFDLQRTYLSGLASGVSECPPHVLSYLLPSELLFSTVLYLVNIKSKLFPSQTTLLTKEFTRQRLILAQTVLSGLRLLLIRKEPISVQDKWRLQAAINTAWQRDRLYGVEAFIVSELFACILDSVNESRANAYINEWLNARLPTYDGGLYPVDIRPETFVTGLIHGTMEEDWADAYWVLFDVLWGVESAITQRYVDIRRQSAVTGHSIDLIAESDETLELLYQTRTSLLSTIFHSPGPMTPPPGLMNSLATSLLEWNDDLETFLSRQDSVLRAAPRVEHNRTTSYGKQVMELSGYYENAQKGFSVWLSNRRPGFEQFTIRPSVSSSDMQEMVRDWLIKMTSTDAETQAKDLECPVTPVYIVDCPKLHAIPKRLLEYKLRWCDKWAYESVQEMSPVVNWKEGIQCPSCTSSTDKIKFARLLEPFQSFATALEQYQTDDCSVSQYSTGDLVSHEAASATSVSEGDSGGTSNRSQPTVPTSLPSTGSQRSLDLPIPPKPSENPPSYLDSPISPATYMHRSLSHDNYSTDSPVSPFNESLNIPIPLSSRVPAASRMSMNLPIPVKTPPLTDARPDTRSSIESKSTVEGDTKSDLPSPRLNTPSLSTPSIEPVRPVANLIKTKNSSRTIRLANSIRRKPTIKEKEAFPLPKDPSFLFSTSGHSLLLWGKGGDYLIRFDIPSSDTTAIQGCKYEISGIEAAAAGNHKCVIIAARGLEQRKIVVYNGIDIVPECELEIAHGRAGPICLAVSRNDQYVATSINDQIHIYKIEDGEIRPVSFHHQIQVYELRGGLVHRRTIPVGRGQNTETATPDHHKDPGWFGASGKNISSKEAAEEAQRSGAIISRRLYFSLDSRRLVVATQLGDHHVYVDVWDCSRQPVSMISEHSRSFPLPPWTLNDGDLTGVFYDTARRCAVLTAFLGKEYPLMVPFPGYDELQNETYSTKIVYAAQNPSSTSFVVANAMTEIIQFEYSPKGILAPHKLKKASAKISASVFKPGCIALSMPLDNTLHCFWIKDGKCMLRSVKIGAGEAFRDFDIRPQYDRLMSLKDRPIIARAPTLRIPELGAGD